MVAHVRSRKFTDEVYWRARILLEDVGQTWKDVAKKVKVNRSTLRYHLQKGLPPSQLHRQRRSLSKPQAASIRKRRRLVKQFVVEEEVLKEEVKNSRRQPRVRTRRKYRSPALISRAVYTHSTQHNSTPHVQASLSTVRRDLEAMGFKARVRPRGPVRYLGDEKRRVEFCKRHIGDNPRNIVFCDEKMCDSEDSDLWEWCPFGGAPRCREKERFPPRIHVWGLVGVNVKKLVMLDTGALDSCKYRDVCLKPSMSILRRKTFVQDNAGAHKGCERYLESKGVNRMEWVARSPDLNPIERVWTIISRQVGERGPLTCDGLRSCVREVWEQIPQEYIDNLVLSWPKQLQECIDIKGKTVVKWV